MVKNRNDKGCIGVYTHGGAIRYLLARLDLMPKKDAWKVPINNTSITELEYKNGIYTLVRLNDSKHLSLDDKDLEERKIEFMNFLLTNSCSSFLTH
jgi:broad specificity phosphatase PhoE